MCKLDKKNGNKRIDPCMHWFIRNLQIKGFKTLACCCGHGKYQMTVVIEANTNLYGKRNMDLISGIIIPRAKRFYKKDKQGYYYIPEVVECLKK